MNNFQNEELPYEQQMLSVLRRYDKLVEENEAMRKELAEYRPLGKPGKVRASLHRCELLEKQHAQALQKMEDYLAGLGIENEYHTFMGAVARIVKI